MDMVCDLAHTIMLIGQIGLKRLFYYYYFVTAATDADAANAISAVVFIGVEEASHQNVRNIWVIFMNGKQKPQVECWKEERKSEKNEQRVMTVMKTEHPNMNFENNGSLANNKLKTQEITTINTIMANNKFTFWNSTHTHHV